MYDDVWLLAPRLNLYLNLNLNVKPRGPNPFYQGKLDGFYSSLDIIDHGSSCLDLLRKRHSSLDYSLLYTV